MLKINKRIVRPEPGTKMLACDNLARRFEQRDEHLKGLLLQRNFETFAAQLSRAQINFEGSEANRRMRTRSFVHKRGGLECTPFSANPPAQIIENSAFAGRYFFNLEKLQKSDAGHCCPFYQRGYWPRCYRKTFLRSKSCRSDSPRYSPPSSSR